MILAIMKAIYGIVYIEAWNKSRLQWGLNLWSRDTFATL